MKNNKSNKRDNRKLLILVLLLFVVIGVTGYGAYSYFWTSGSFSAEDQVSIAAFDPDVDGNFLGNGGTLTLTCPNSTYGYETVNCTGTLTVNNNGGTDITVSVDEETASVSPYTGSNDDVNASAGTPTFSWSSSTISSSSSETLTVTVPVTLTSHFGSSEGYERTSEYTGEDFTVDVSFKIIAAQVH